MKSIKTNIKTLKYLAMICVFFVLISARSNDCICYHFMNENDEINTTVQSLMIDMSSDYYFELKEILSKKLLELLFLVKNDDYDRAVNFFDYPVTEQELVYFKGCEYVGVICVICNEGSKKFTAIFHISVDGIAGAYPINFTTSNDTIKFSKTKIEIDNNNILFNIILGLHNGRKIDSLFKKCD